MMQSGKDTVQGIIEGARSKENELRLEMQRMARLIERSMATVPDIRRVSGGTPGTVVSNESTANTYGGDTYNITIDAKNVREINDIVRMARSARQERRAGG